MFGCFGLCGDCFSTSPIPLLVKRFYCSFAIQSKERKEREEEEEKVLFNWKVGEYCNQKYWKYTLTSCFSTFRKVPMAYKKVPPPPLHPFKKATPFARTFFSSNIALCLKFLAVLFFLTTGFTGTFKYFRLKHFFSFLKFKSLKQFFDFSSETLLFYCFCCPSIWEWGAAGE